MSASRSAEYPVFQHLHCTESHIAYVAFVFVESGSPKSITKNISIFLNEKKFIHVRIKTYVNYLNVELFFLILVFKIFYTLC